MKKGLKIGLIVVGIIVLTIVIDFIAIFTISRPIFAIERDNHKYSGLFYNTFNCPEFSMPSVHNKFSKYSCAMKEKKVVKDIKDKTKEIENFTCAEALEGFYSDDTYDYYYSCIKGNFIVVIYEDGSEETVSEALKAGNIKISDLDKYGITYHKYKKVD